MSHILVLTTLPSRETAIGIAQALLDARLAACVSIGAPVVSMYHWQGATETSDEVPLAIKTRAALFDDVATSVRSRHPYELPEIIAVPIIDGTADYVGWIDDATAPQPAPAPR